ncbi:MutS-related protein [Chitinophaga sp. NPDC101104]|uniref:MutS-related protein n=1 Tax=Chitinophaga sp. NPDC101104 TaxID=3390561 RepID=UPI003CFD4E02
MPETFQIPREIVSLFDHTYSRPARQLLEDFFQSGGLSLQQILDRQAVLKTFIRHWKHLQHFAYSRYDFEEVLTFTTQADYFAYEFPGVWARMFPSTNRKLVRGKSVQVMFFFERLDAFYFPLPEGIGFPEAFQEKVDRIQRVLARLKIKRGVEAVHKDRFGDFHASMLLKELQDMKQRKYLDPFWEALHEFEMYWSLAKGIVAHGLIFPEFYEGPLRLEGFYHPLVKHAVRNDFTGGSNIVLLTGPNMGGKSTAMKGIGLCVMLGHLGLGVPAEKCALPKFDAFMAALNVTDDISTGLSHYMQEVIYLKSVAEAAVAGQRCFAMFDELFSGTNTEEAVALLVQTVRGLQRFTSGLFIISTHLVEIRPALESVHYDAMQMEARIDDGVPVQTYRLKPGWSELKLGNLLFGLAGLHELLGKNPSN